jgi:hypothetical protein
VIIEAAIAAQRSGIDNLDLPLDGVSVVAMPRIVQKILGSRLQAITIVRTVVVDPDVFERVVAGSEPELLAHELIHVAQWEDHGILPFSFTYLRDYLRMRLLGATHDAAYRSIGFEYQAYTGARDITRSLS